MKIIKEKIFSVELCEKDPNTVYVFGDNVQRTGKGGQAIIRDCVNSFGIATKLQPTNNDDAFFQDNPECLAIVQKDIGTLKLIIESDIYDTVALPESGIGTGLAQLQTKAPNILKYIECALNNLIKIYNKEI